MPRWMMILAVLIFPVAGLILLIVLAIKKILGW